jgi:hypothetical protein
MTLRKSEWYVAVALDCISGDGMVLSFPCPIYPLACASESAPNAVGGSEWYIYCVYVLLNRLCSLFVLDSFELWWSGVEPWQHGSLS